MAWLQTARAWYMVTTDTRGTIAPAAAEAADLALWTGRLAYADPSWTMTLGPSQPARTPQDLAPEPADLPAVVAAVHQACQTMTSIAAADYTQVRAATQAGRLLVPTRSLPESFDIPQRFALASRDRVSALLAAYDDAGTTSAHATEAVASAAADVRAPSHILTLARAAAQAGAAPTRRNRPPPAEPAAEPHEAPGFPGPVERILRDLGVTSPDVLHRAAAIDQASEQLILNGAHDTGPRNASTEAIGISRSAGTAELINRILASGNPHAAATLRPPPPPRDNQPNRIPAQPRQTGGMPGSRIPGECPRAKRSHSQNAPVQTVDLSGRRKAAGPHPLGRR